jgi:Antitoxin VbhA
VVSDQGRRALAVGNALASVHLEGGEIGSEMKALAERYVAGEITIDQLIEFGRDCHRLTR